MNIKREDIGSLKPSSSLKPNASTKKQVTFIDLTGDVDREDAVMKPPLPRAVASSSSVLRDIEPNVEVAFTLDRNAQPSPQRSNELVFNENSSSRTTPSSATKMRTSAITLLDTQHGRERRMQRVSVYTCACSRSLVLSVLLIDPSSFRFVLVVSHARFLSC
jgi:CHASE2 domain-containing sensor protein